MCKLCDDGKPQDHTDDTERSRRDFLKASAATGAAAAALNLFNARPADAQPDAPADSGRRGRRYIIRGGHVMTMDPGIGDFVEADVLVEGKRIVAVGPNLDAGGAGVIDARGRIVMPGFVDTLVDVDLPRLRRQLEQSRDYLFEAANIEQDLFREN